MTHDETAAYPRLEAAFLTQAAALLDRLSETGKPEFVDRQHWPQKWYEVSHPYFAPLQRQVWNFNIHDVWEVARNTPEFAELLSELAAVPELSAQLNQIVGWSNSLRTLRFVDLLLSYFLAEIVEDERAYIFNESLARETYRRIERELMNSVVRVRQVLPVAGVVCMTTVEGPAGLRLRPLTEREFSRVIDMGAVAFRRTDDTVEVPAPGVVRSPLRQLIQRSSVMGRACRCLSPTYSAKRTLSSPLCGWLAAAALHLARKSTWRPSRC